MEAIFFSLVALIGWAVGDIFTVISSRRIGSFSASFYGYAFGIVPAIFFIPFVLSDLPNFKVDMVLLTVFLTFFEIFGFLAFNEALRIGNSSIVETVSGAFPSLVVILSIIFLREQLTPLELVAILIIIAGIVLSSLHLSDLKNKRKILNKGTALALFSMISWAIYFTFIKIPVDSAGFFWPSFLTLVVGSVFFLLVSPKKIVRPKIPFEKGMLAAFMSGVLLTIGSFGFNIGISKGLSAIVAPISGAYPAIFVVLAFFIFKDPISKLQKFGVGTALVGIIFLSYLTR